MTPNTERIELLVNALESGEFTQDRMELRSENGKSHCCLGVACELYRRATGEGEWDKTDFLPTEPERMGVLPRQVQAWFGFDSDNPLVRIDGLMLAAAAANDAGSTFAEIAQGFRNTYLCPTT